MAGDITTLNRVIRELNRRWDDLERMLTSIPDPERRLEVIDVMDLVNLKIMQMENKRNHLRATIVTVRPPTAADRQVMAENLEAVSVHVAQDQEWQAAHRLIVRALQAAGRIKTNLESRQV